MTFFGFCHVLTLVPFVCFYFSLVRARVGWAFYVLFLCLYFHVFGLIWFPIRGSCQSLSLIENHTYSHSFFVGGYFPFQCFSPFGTVSFFLYSLVRLFPVFSVINMTNTYHAAYWSDISYSSSEEEDDNSYRTTQHNRTKQRGNQEQRFLDSWTWEEILDGRIRAGGS
jgi:hypothetical protein